MKGLERGWLMMKYRLATMFLPGRDPGTALTDAVVRLVPDSWKRRLRGIYAAQLLEYPHYTRPPEYRGCGFLLCSYRGSWANCPLAAAAAAGENRKDARIC